MLSKQDIDAVCFVTEVSTVAVFSRTSSESISEDSKLFTDYTSIVGAQF